MIKILEKLLEPIIAKAYEEGYKKGANDIVRRMTYVYDVCRLKGLEDGLADAGAIDLSKDLPYETD